MFKGDTKMRTGIFTVALVTLMLSPVTPVSAESYGYVGLTFGLADATDFDDLCNPNVSGGQCDSSGPAWKAFGGYQITDIWGVEVSYVDFGDFDARGATGENVKAEVSAFTLAGTVAWPVREECSLFLKVGASAWDMDVSTNVVGASGDDGTDIFYGVGVLLKASDFLRLRVEYEVYSDVGAQFQGMKLDTDINLLALSAVYTF